MDIEIAAKNQESYKEYLDTLKGFELMDEKHKIKKSFGANKITYDEGKALAILVIDRQNTLGEAVAKKFGKRFSRQKFTTLSRLN